MVGGVVGCCQSHTSTVPASLDAASAAPLGLNATPLTVPGKCSTAGVEWGSRQSTTRAVPSSSPTARYRPLGLNATPFTTSENFKMVGLASG